MTDGLQTAWEAIHGPPEPIQAMTPKYENATAWAIAYVINNWIAAGIDRGE